MKTKSRKSKSRSEAIQNGKKAKRMGAAMDMLLPEKQVQGRSKRDSYTPQFKDVTFKGSSHKESQDAFSKWLKRLRFKTINLVDRGFDLLQIVIHESGEILHCNANASIYNGQFVDLEKLEVGRSLIINGKEYGNLIPEIIEDHKKSK